MKAGICKIVPPAGWQPPFAINEKTFRFRTRVQQLNCIDGHTRAEGNFVDALRLFLYRHGTPMKELPRVDGQLLNLHLLYKVVLEMGGFDVVCHEALWSSVVRRVGRTRASDAPTPALCALYQEHYETCLLPFERHERMKKEPFQTPDVKGSSGGAPATTASTTPSKMRTSAKHSLIRRRSEGDVTIDSTGDASPDAKRVKRTLFSDGGHTSNDDSDCVVEVKTEDGIKSEPISTEYTDTSIKTRMQADSAIDVVDRKPMLPSELDVESLRPNPKRTVRLDPPELHVGQKYFHYFPESGAVVGEIQRVVRGRKPHVVVRFHNDGSKDTIDLGTMQILVANGWDPEAAELAFKSEICQTCLRGDCWDRMLLCDGCNSGHHLFCLAKPLKEVPVGDWYCDACVEESEAPTKDANPKFGFEMGSEYNLETYKERADNWKRTYFGVTNDHELDKISDRELEREYWRILSTPAHEQRLEVEYGSDVDSGAVGSGFPRIDDYMKCVKAIGRRLRILSAKKDAPDALKRLCKLFSTGSRQCRTRRSGCGGNSEEVRHG
ncbi:hypothetical protein PINS_up006366 [Pythium insidiosum]|nr:hypothetical protein PINS_up006366 [Pythium insidiosum]